MVVLASLRTLMHFGSNYPGPKSDQASEQGSCGGYPECHTKHGDDQLLSLESRRLVQGNCRCERDRPVISTQMSALLDSRSAAKQLVAGPVTSKSLTWDSGRADICLTTS